jgi:hypothetical protein
VSGVPALSLASAPAEALLRPMPLLPRRPGPGGPARPPPVPPVARPPW